MALNIFRFAFFTIFTGLHCCLLAGLFREWRWDRRRVKRSGPPATVSVVVPIHNEASRLPRLLETLALQDYPQRELVFIDDRSTDGSARMLRCFAALHPATVLITLEENPGPNRKQYALRRGIEAASGGLLLLTDADCEGNPGWIRAMSARMADPRIGVSLGPVFKRPGKAGFFHRYQCFDHAVRYMYLAASTGLGAAGGGFGNNLIIRREALDAIGGYQMVPPSPTEDAALISQVRRATHYQVRAVCASDAWVFTAGEPAWKALIHQTLRWNNGGLFSPDLLTRLNFSFLMIAISLGILAIPLLPFFPRLWPLTAAVLISMTMNTLAVLGLFSAALPPRGISYGVQVLFTPAFFTFLTLLGFFGLKPSWKGSVYSQPDR
jgi:cellulose synthase/poly-beta-1,6-N-acetylglucosamine synthase-like glycosyltransferase